MRFDPAHDAVNAEKRFRPGFELWLKTQLDKKFPGESRRAVTRRNKARYALLNEGVLLVRARVKEHLEQLREHYPFLIVDTESAADYKYRALVPNQCVRELFEAKIRGINYGSHYKEICRDRAPRGGEYYSAMMKVWSDMMTLQTGNGTGYGYGGSGYSSYGSGSSYSSVSTTKPALCACQAVTDKGVRVYPLKWCSKAPHGPSTKCSFQEADATVKRTGDYPDNKAFASNQLYYKTVDAEKAAEKTGSLTLSKGTKSPSNVWDEWGEDGYNSTALANDDPEHLVDEMQKHPAFDVETDTQTPPVSANLIATWLAFPDLFDQGTRPLTPEEVGGIVLYVQAQVETLDKDKKTYDSVLDLLYLDYRDIHKSADKTEEDTEAAFKVATEELRDMLVAETTVPEVVS